LSSVNRSFEKIYLGIFIHEFMSEIFGFDLPDKSKELTDKEYVNLVNRIRGNFLSYVAILDSTLTVIISDLFLQDKNDFAHNFAHNKKIESENVKNKLIKLYDFEEGITTPKIFKMEDIMNLINDPWILENLKKLEILTRKIRER